MKILVFGASGQVASALLDAAVPGLDIVALGRPEGDLTDPEVPARMIASQAPDIVINAAAYTAVDKAEDDQDAAFALNAEGPGRLAEACAEHDLPLIHYSTDYVYDGSKAGIYTEDDPTAPLGVYGRSKLAGEDAIAAATDNHVILRTAWVFSPYGSNFVKTMLRLGASRDSLSIVEDQVGNPSYAPHLARATLAIARQIADGAPYRGIYHMTGSGETSWFGFAKAIFEQAGDLVANPPRLTPIPSSQYPTPAKRPANSRLDCSRLKADFAIELPHWSEGLTQCLSNLRTQSGEDQ